MKRVGYGPQEREAAARVLSQRLSPAEIRSVVREDYRAPRGGKGIERIVAETENAGTLLRTRLEDDRLASFLVDVGGPDLLVSRHLRYLLAVRASDAELDSLHDFPGGTRARGTSAEALARCVAQRNWHAGKRWARYFARVLGFPAVFAGVPGTPGGPDVEQVEPHVPLPALQDFQEDLRQQLLEVVSARPGANRAVLTLPTGAGKTRTTVEALIDWWLGDRDGDFILWIAQSDELCEQAVQAFREVWIDRGDQGVRETIRLYRFWGGRRIIPDEEGPGVIVSTIDKLRKSLLGPQPADRQAALLQLLRSTGVIVIDEAHRAEAASYRRALEALGVDFTARTRSTVPIIGLTATPLRSQHEETVRLARRFYNRLLRPRNLAEDPGAALEELRTRGVLSRPEHKVIASTERALRLTKEQENYLEEFKDLHPDILAELGESKTRNRQLLNAILRMDATWPVLFFGCSVQHAEALALLLRRHGREAAVVTADTREATRRHLVEAFRHGEIAVLSNYGVLTTGFDAPRVRAIVVGRPTSSRLLYEQMIGRGMRGPSFGGTDECLVVDIDDNLVHTDGAPFRPACSQYGEYWVAQTQ